MYQNLLALLNQYLIVGITTGIETAYYRMRLLKVTPDFLEAELYSKNGDYEGRFMSPLATVTTIKSDTRELRELSLKVNYNHQFFETPVTH